MACAPRTVVATREPMAVSATASTARATSTSTSVNPASARRRLERGAWDNLDTSGEPVDSDFVAHAFARERDRPSAGHARGEELNRVAGRTPVASGSQQGIEFDIGRHADQPPGRT